MHLGRSPLLIEGLPVRRPVDPRAETKDPIRQGLHHGQSDAKAPPIRRGRSASHAPLGLSSSPDASSQSWPKGKHEPDWHMSLSDHTVRKMNKSSEGKTQIMRKGKGSTRILKPRTLDLGKSDEGNYDPRFPSQLHHDVHKMSTKDAHGELDKIWNRRHKVNPADTDRESFQGKEHYTKTDSTGSKSKGTQPALIAKRGSPVLTGNKHMLPVSMPGRHHPDESVRKRAWKMQAQSLANSVGDSYSSRRSSGKRRSARVKVRVVKGVDGKNYTQTAYAHKPSTPLGKGEDVVHSTMSEALMRTPLLIETLTQMAATHAAPLEKTQIIMPRSEPESLDKPRKKRRTDTVRLPRQNAEKIVKESDLVRTPMLQEFVAHPSNSTGNTFLSTTKPGTRISGAPSTTNDTGKVGLVSKQGGVVPDKKKREVKLPDLSKFGKKRDAITDQLAKLQPSNTGGVLTMIARSRAT